MRRTQDLFIKRGNPRSSSLMGEAAALCWLAEAESVGGMPTAKVVSASPTELVENRIMPGRATAKAAEQVGVALAITHAAGAPWWGAPPTGWEDAYLIGESATPTISKDVAPATWGAFFAEWRIMSYARQAYEAGAMTSNELALVERVAVRLTNGDYDVPQPALVESRRRQTADASSKKPDGEGVPPTHKTSTPVARIHGDLWSGNLLWDADPSNPVGATLIDPMAHGGHAETDLAMLALFGCPFLDRIISAYNEVSPLADGWRERVSLHQLAPLLHHCALFGSGYVPETMQAARRYT